MHLLPVSSYPGEESGCYAKCLMANTPADGLCKLPRQTSGGTNGRQATGDQCLGNAVVEVFS